MRNLKVEELNALAEEMGSNCTGCNEIEECHTNMTLDEVKRSLSLMTPYDEDTDDEDDADYDECPDDDCDCDGNCSNCECEESTPDSGMMLVEMWLEDQALDIDEWAADMSADEAEGKKLSALELKLYAEAVALYGEIARLRQFELDNR